MIKNIIMLSGFGLMGRAFNIDEKSMAPLVIGQS